jgi:Activator of Hsp90 ATPase homolog 1-like protein
VNGVDEFEGHGEVLEIDPPRLLVYTWIANWHADPKRKTNVRWELAPSQGGTNVKVAHSGLAEEAVAARTTPEAGRAWWRNSRSSWRNKLGLAGQRNWISGSRSVIIALLWRTAMTGGIWDR